MRMLTWVFLILFVATPSIAMGAQTVYGAFVFDDTDPNSLFLGYPITPSSPLDFGRAMRAHPDVAALIVFSEGGDVTGALLIAEQVHERGMATIIPVGTGCYSACAFVFFAGTPRYSAGELGVHQFSGGSEDMSSVQYSVAEILDALSRFQTPSIVLADMFRTKPDDMFVYKPADAIRLGLNTVEAPPNEPQAATEPEGPGDVLQSPLDLGPVELGDIFASPLSSTLLWPDAPETAAINYPSPGPDLDPTATTVVAKTLAAADVGLGRAERLITLIEPSDLSAVLRKNGFTTPMTVAVDQVRMQVFPDQTLPTGTMLRILFGPSRNSNSLIPYRLSIYMLQSQTLALHRVTIALTDSGQYVVGEEPAPMKMGDKAIGAPRLTQPSADPSNAGKGPRSRRR